MEPWWLVPIIVAVVLIAAAAVLVIRRRRADKRAAAPREPAPSPADRLRKGLEATRRRLAARLDRALGTGPGNAEVALNEVEEALVEADVGVRTAAELVARIRARVGRQSDRQVLREALREELEATLAAEAPPEPSSRPWVILVTGVNGVGKTTTIGKLAALHAARGRRVLMVAADTFRAAAIEQLEVWAQRTGAELIRQDAGANPAAVAFDGIKAATARGADVVLIDTAGRLHTRTNLMEELGKVRRVIGRELPGAPHETFLVLDATTGQNAVAQARTFAEAVGVTGVVLTKLDGTARGGVAIAVRREIGAPLRYVGVGEAVEDLRPFEARVFVDALLGSGTCDAEASESLTASSVGH
jgi:fused signal recognition particle receptor